MSWHREWMCSLLLAIALAAGPRLSAQAPPVEQEAPLAIIGALSGSNLYLTYIALESVAENFSCGNYTSAQASTLTKSIVKLIEGTRSKLLNARRLENISASDEEFITALDQAYAILHTEAGHLLAYSGSLDADDLSNFLDAKHRSWEKIQQLLGLDKSILLLEESVE